MSDIPAAPDAKLPPPRGALHGRKVMIVEDELLVAMLLEEALVEHGCEIVGPFSTVETALDAARHVVAHVAVLDVNLRGKRVYPVAELLEARGIPFLLMSGYGRDGVPPEHAHWVACSKPFLPGDLVAALTGLLPAPIAG